MHNLTGDIWETYEYCGHNLTGDIGGDIGVLCAQSYRGHRRGHMGIMCTTLKGKWGA